MESGIERDGGDDDQGDVESVVEGDPVRHVGDGVPWDWNR